MSLVEREVLTDKAGVGVGYITVHVHAEQVVNGMLQGHVRYR